MNHWLVFYVNLNFNKPKTKTDSLKNELLQIKLTSFTFFCLVYIILLYHHDLFMLGHQIMHLNFWHLNMLNHSKTHVQLLWVTNKWFIRISRWKEGHSIIWSLICKKLIFWGTHYLRLIYYCMHGPLFQTRKDLKKLIYEMIGVRKFKTFFFRFRTIHWWLW